MSDELNLGENKTDTTKMYRPPSLMNTHHAHIGPILGVLVIMLVLILSGLYLWGGMLSNEVIAPTEPPIVNNEPETVRATTDTQILETVSPSDDLNAIEADLSSTNLDSLDTDLTAIDAELAQ